MRLLLLCTANQCRSAMAEVIVRDLVGDGGTVEVRSRGTMPGGQPASDHAAREAHRRGLDLRDHVSREITADDVDWADLILTMERRHIGHVAALDLGAVARTFTLPEAASLGHAAGRRRAGQSIAEKVGELDRYRIPGTALTSSIDDDLADPTGRGRRAHRRAADQISSLLAEVLGVLRPEAPG